MFNYNPFSKFSKVKKLIKENEESYNKLTIKIREINAEFREGNSEADEVINESLKLKREKIELAQAEIADIHLLLRNSLKDEFNPKNLFLLNKLGDNTGSIFKANGRDLMEIGITMHKAFEHIHLVKADEHYEYEKYIENIKNNDEVKDWFKQVLLNKNHKDHIKLTTKYLEDKFGNIKEPGDLFKVYNIIHEMDNRSNDMLFTVPNEVLTEIHKCIDKSKFEEYITSKGFNLIVEE